MPYKCKAVRLTQPAQQGSVPEPEVLADAITDRLFLIREGVYRIQLMVGNMYSESGAGGFDKSSFARWLAGALRDLLPLTAPRTAKQCSVPEEWPCVIREAADEIADYDIGRPDLHSTLYMIADKLTTTPQPAKQGSVPEVESALRDLVAIVRIHCDATGSNFAWAEVEHAQEALSKLDSPLACPGCDTEVADQSHPEGLCDDCKTLKAEIYQRSLAMATAPQAGGDGWRVASSITGSLPKEGYNECDWCGETYPDAMLQNETQAGDAICDE